MIDIETTTTTLFNLTCNDVKLGAYEQVDAWEGFIKVRGIDGKGEIVLLNTDYSPLNFDSLFGCHRTKNKKYTIVLASPSIAEMIRSAMPEQPKSPDAAHSERLD